MQPQKPLWRRHDDSHDVHVVDAVGILLRYVGAMRDAAHQAGVDGVGRKVEIVRERFNDPRVGPICRRNHCGSISLEIHDVAGPGREPIRSSTFARSSSSKPMIADLIPEGPASWARRMIGSI